MGGQAHLDSNRLSPGGHRCHRHWPLSVLPLHDTRTETTLARLTTTPSTRSARSIAGLRQHQAAPLIQRADDPGDCLRLATKILRHHRDVFAGHRVKPQTSSTSSAMTAPFPKAHLQCQPSAGRPVRNTPRWATTAVSCKRPNVCSCRTRTPSRWTCRPTALSPDQQAAYSQSTAAPESRRQIGCHLSREPRSQCRKPASLRAQRVPPGQQYQPLRTAATCLRARRHGAPTCWPGAATIT